MNAIKIPDQMPPQLNGLSGETLRSAFMATVLAQVPPSYRNQLPDPANDASDYKRFWDASLSILQLYKTEMDSISGGDWSPSRVRRPETVKPHELVQAAFQKRQSFVGRPKQPIVAANLPRRSAIPGDTFMRGSSVQ